MLKENYLSICVGVFTVLLITTTYSLDEELIEECMESLSCNSIALQLIDSFGLPFNRKRFQTTSSLQLNLLETRKSVKNRKSIIVNICKKDFLKCQRDIVNLAKVLNVQFNFECKTTILKEPCDIWDFFEIYLHCDARGDQQLLVDEKLWMEEKCLNRTTQLNNTCHSSCKFNHTHLTPPTPCQQIKSPVQCLRSPTCGYCFDTCVKTTNGASCTEKSNLDVIGCKVRKFKDVKKEEVIDIDSNCADKPKSIVLAPGQKKNITFSFVLQKHPLDFYYLMDFTGSMGDDRASLERLAPQLVTTLQGLTPNLRVGFGSFLDKAIHPFGAPYERYAFKNILPLTSDTSQLQKNIKATQIGNGNDIPEDAGDALIQVSECTKEIGWRDNARHIVLVATAPDFHFPPNKEFPKPYVHGCYLDASGNYTQAITMDYPTIDQIANAVAKNKIRVIFAVDRSQVQWYNENTKRIEGAVIAQLSSDSANVINIVIQEFNKFDSSLELLKPETKEDTVKFRYFSNCANKVDKQGAYFCDKLPKGGTVSFTVEVDLAKCPTDKKETGMDLKFNALGLPELKELSIHYAC